ncbi:MAG TPA: helix-turn-helix transcriptional regulator [Cellulomonas sp.]
MSPEEVHVDQPVEAPVRTDRPDPTTPPGVALHATVVDSVVAYLLDGTSVDLVGMRASGRSTVVGLAAGRTSAAGRVVVRVAGMRALRDRPLAALALAGVPVAPVPGQLPALVSAVGSIEEMLADRPAVLLVDDADDLDPASVGAIVAAHARTRTPVLAISRPGGHRRPDGLAAGLTSGVRVRLDPLGFEDLHALVHATLGGAVEPATLARLAAVSGGLPGLVTAVIGAARRENRLVHRDGLWVARGDLWCTPLTQAVEAFLTDVGEQGLDAATLLSLVGATPLRSVGRMVAPATLATLDDLGLLRVRPGTGEPVVEVFPPLLSQYLARERSTLGAVLGRERIAAAAPATGPAAAPDPQPVPETRTVPGLAAVPEPRSGPRLGPAPVTGGDAAGSGSGRPWCPEQLRQRWADEVAACRRRWHERPAPATATALLAALAVTSAPVWEIEEVVDRSARLDGPAADRAALACWTARYRAATTGSLPAALAVLAPVRGTVPGYEAVLRAAEIHVRLAVGSRPHGVLLAPADPSDSEPARDVLAVAHAECAAAAARPGEVAAVLAGCRPADLSVREDVERLEALALLLAGDVAGGVRAARAGVDRAGAAMDVVALHEHAYVAAYGLALQGRVVELQELTSSVLALGVVPVHRPQVVGGILTFAAVAAHWQSRRDFARSVAMQATAGRGTRGAHPFMATDLVEELLRDGTVDAEPLWDAARERMAGGFVAAGIVLGVRAVERDPRADRAEVLAAAAADGGSDLLRHLAGYAQALAADDAGQLAAQEVALGAAGLGQYAVRAAVALSARLLEDGRPRDAIEHADAAWSRAGLRGRDLCGLFRPLDRAVRVTPREREVAVLVARGCTPPEIAERMVLSVRTVESHIFSACRKVGADGREGLARAAQTWLTCAAT